MIDTGGHFDYCYSISTHIHIVLLIHELNVSQTVSVECFAHG